MKKEKIDLEKLEKEAKEIGKELERRYITVVSYPSLDPDESEIRSRNDFYWYFNPMKDNFIRAEERFKHNEEKLKQIYLDWRDYCKLLDEKYQDTSKPILEAEFQIRIEEIKRRFEYLLNQDNYWKGRNEL